MATHNYPPLSITTHHYPAKKHHKTPLSSPFTLQTTTTHLISDDSSQLPTTTHYYPLLPTITWTRKTINHHSPAISSSHPPLPISYLPTTTHNYSPLPTITQQYLAKNTTKHHYPAIFCSTHDYPLLSSSYLMASHNYPPPLPTTIWPKNTQPFLTPT